jgi:TolB-like protein/tetratricopeptide (TPR) repeat protein
MKPIVVGQALGPYRIDAQLGAGAMGVVYRAYDMRLQRTVAIKVLSNAHGEPRDAARVLHEARSASALNHPNICTIHEVTDLDGQPFIVMEHVEGRALSDVIPDGGLPVETFLRYGVQIADALAHAHDRGIVHRDLKAANVVITREGRPKVLDFGLAGRLPGAELEEATRSQGSLEKAGVIAGTLAYMAPEVLRGERATEQCDIWALGVMLCEMAGIGRPFAGRTGSELSSAILRDPPTLPAQLPASLRAVILRCLAKEPSQRYQRAGEVRAALEMMPTEPGRTSVDARGLTRRAPGRRTALIASASVALAVFAVFVGMRVGALRNRDDAVAARPHIESLAVLPLENLSRDPEQGYFVDGITDALIANLAKISSLRVISRTSVMQYKSARRPLPEIAQALKVDAVVEGSVQRAGDRVRITAQLIHAQTDRHLWAESYDRDLRDVLALQSEVARAIAREIRITLTPGEQARLAAARPVDPVAHEAYLKGEHFWHLATESSVTKSVEYFEEAVRFDPQFALGYAGLSAAHHLLASAQWVADKEAYPKARAAAVKAISLDEGLSRAHASLAFVMYQFDRDWAGAEREFKLAIDLEPGSQFAHHAYATYLNQMGRPEDALREIQRALALDPFSALTNNSAGSVHAEAGRLEDALSKYQRSLELSPASPIPHNGMGRVFLRQRKYDLAIAEFEQARRLSGHAPRFLASVGYAYGVAGRKREAVAILTELKKIARQRYVSAVDLAALAAAVGEEEQAYGWLQQAFEDSEDGLLLLNSSGAFDELRGQSRFEALVRRMAFPSRAR